MNRRDVLRHACAMAFAPALSGLPAAFAAGPGNAFDAIFERALARSPEAATTYGLDTGERSALRQRLDDRSRDNRFGYYEALIESQASLASDAAGDAREQIFRECASWFASTVGEFRRFPYGGIGGYAYPVPYVVSQLTGAYQSVPDFLDTQHPIESADDAGAYLERLAALPRAIDQDTDNLRADAARHVIAPAVILDRTIAQLHSFATGQRGESAGLVRSLVRRTATHQIRGDWAARAIPVVDGPLARAIERQRAAVAELRRRARVEVGVNHQPDGDAYYAACLRFHTSTALNPTDAHALGLAQVEEITARASDILKAAGLGTTTVSQGLHALTLDRRYWYPNDEAGRAAVLDYIRALERDMTERLPRAFSHLPRTPLEVRRVPEAIELGAPSAYSLSGSIDGTRPGGIYFNLHETSDWPKWTIATTAYHEGLPGHHLQGSLANEATDIPPLFKILGANAYNEGWALYAEQLADELGAYEEDPLGRLGMLQGSLFRACRIVVDTGLHTLGWSRERAIAYLVERAGSTANDARREIERYISWPGQACGYKMGHLEFLRLRARAKERLGTHFTLPGFHDTVLGYGSLPLMVLGHAVDGWIGRVLSGA